MAYPTERAERGECHFADHKKGESSMKRKTWQKGLAAFLAVACLPLGSLSVPSEVRAADPAEVSVVAQGNSVTIGNDYISREFSVSGGKLSTVTISN